MTEFTAGTWEVPGKMFCIDIFIQVSTKPVHICIHIYMHVYMHDCLLFVKHVRDFCLHHLLPTSLGQVRCPKQSQGILQLYLFVFPFDLSMIKEINFKNKDVL